MEYETGVFKRYERKRGNKTVTQVGVSGLSVNSKFKDNEVIYILSKDDINQLQQQASNNNDKVKDLENQLTKANTEIDTLKNMDPNPAPENQVYTHKVIDLQEEINNLNKTINNRNELLLGTQDKVNGLLDELTTEITKLYDNTITEANSKTKTNITVILDTIKETYQAITDYNEELENQIQKHNNNIENSSIITRAFSKDRIKLKLDTGKLQTLEKQLKELNDNCITYNNIVKPVEIPASKIKEIKLNVKSNKFDVKELYIDTGDKDEKEENITITPEAVNNGNDN